ncbi:hypothetical protein BB560_004092 [Smittium megazygosporum]|uniref:Golgi SNAP receptor complex member 1 n=1 Tax=Smittium megazygosporum TaxID=133381 RepID=A0A2T9ZA49_9FUNG|nr:hypothetical protein BB560_004092 [Smittium megazygosporum]
MNSIFFKAQNLAYKIEQKLAEHKALSQNANLVDSSMDISGLEAEISGSLKQLETLLEGAESNIEENVNEQMFLRQVERHKNKLYEYSSTFKRQKSNVLNMKRRQALLQGATISKSLNSNEQMLMQERMHIEDSLDQTNHIIGQAYDTRDNLRNQHSSLLGSTNRVTAVSQLIPNLNLLLRRIRFKKQKDKVILAVITAICIILFINYVF